MERNYDVNKNIKRIIDSEDKRPSAIADKAKIRRDTFSRILSNKRPVYAEEIPGICSALGISANELFCKTPSKGN